MLTTIIAGAAGGMAFIAGMAVCSLVLKGRADADWGKALYAQRNRQHDEFMEAVRDIADSIRKGVQ